MKYGNFYLYNGCHLSGKSIEAIGRHKDAVHVDLRQLFLASPNASLRQLLNIHVVSVLLTGADVILEGYGDTYAKRASVIKLLRQKVSSITPQCLVIKAQDRISQYMWLLENLSAEISLGYHVKCQHSHITATEIEAKIYEWENSSDAVDENEGFIIQKCALPIRIQSFWKFDMPALFIQLDSLIKQQANGATGLVAGVDGAIEAWYNCNPCGRVVILHDGSSSTRDPEKQIQSILQQLCIKVADCPIYALLVTKMSLLSSYCKPPNPGVIAYIHRLHYIDLTAQGTVYWYGTSSHMKMAEKAGLKHIKASRVFHHHNLATSKLASSVPVPPPLVAEIEYIKPLRNWCDATREECPIPLLESALECSHEENIVEKTVGTGRKLFMAWSSREKLQLYARLLKDNIRSIDDDEENKITRLSAIKQQQIKPVVEKRPQEVYSVSSDSCVPEWMLAKKQRLEAKRAAKQEKSTSSLRAVRKETVYIMSVKELENIAQKVISEAPEADRLSSGQQPTSVDKDGDSSSVTKNAPPQRKRAVVDDVFEEILDSVSPPKRLRHPQELTNESCWVAETQEYTAHKQTQGTSTLVSPQIVVRSASGSKSVSSNGQDTIRDSLVKDSSSSKSTSRASSGIHTIPDSLVKESSSSKAESKSPRGTHTILDSLVKSTSSSKDRSRSSSGTHTIPDSLVKDSGSSKERSIPSNGSHTVLNSLVKNSTSGSGKSKTSSGTNTIPDSLVKDSSSSRERSRSSRDSHTIPDSLVKESSPSKGNSKSSSERNTIPDSLVKESSSSRERSKSSSGSHNIPDSLVKESSSSKERSRSSDDPHTILDSLVESSTSTGREKSRSSSGNHTIPDSLVRDSRSSNERPRSLTGPHTIPDSLVKNSNSSREKSKSSDGSHTIPESLVKDSSSSSAKSKHSKKLPKSERKTSLKVDDSMDDDLSFLDDLT